MPEKIEEKNKSENKNGNRLQKRHIILFFSVTALFALSGRLGEVFLPMVRSHVYERWLMLFFCLFLIIFLALQSKETAE